MFLPIFYLRPKDQKQYHQVLLVHLASSSSKYTEVHELHPHPISPAHCSHSSTVLTICCGKPWPFWGLVSRYVKHEAKKQMGSFSPIIPWETNKRTTLSCFGVGLFMATEISRKIPFLAARSCQGASLEKSPQQPKVPEQLSQQPHLSWILLEANVFFGLFFFFGKETKQPSGVLQTKFKTRSLSKYIQGCILGNQLEHYILVQSHGSSSAH